MATDNFSVDNFATNWTSVFGSWSASGGRAVPGGSDENLSYWSAQAWSNDHSSEARVHGASLDGGPAVRVAASRCYQLSAGPGGVALYRVDGGGAFTLLQDYVTTAADGDIFKLEVIGSNIKTYKNGSQIGTTQSDTTYATGAPGIWMYNTGSRELDDWVGLDVGGGGGTNRRWRIAFLNIGILMDTSEYSRREAMKRLFIVGAANMLRRFIPLLFLSLLACASPIRPSEDGASSSASTLEKKAAANVWRAEITSAAWSAGNLITLPRQFNVTWDNVFLSFGTATATIQLNDGQTIFATVRGMNASHSSRILIRFWSAKQATWTLEGPGMTRVSGTMERRK